MALDADSPGLLADSVAASKGYGDGFRAGIAAQNGVRQIRFAPRTVGSCSTERSEHSSTDDGAAVATEPKKRKRPAPKIDGFLTVRPGRQCYVTRRLTDKVTTVKSVNPVAAMDSKLTTVKSVNAVAAIQNTKIDASDNSFRVAGFIFQNGEEVFTEYSYDGNWYAGKVTGIQDAKLLVEWYEDSGKNVVEPVDVIRAKDILIPGTLVQVMSHFKKHYDEMTFVEYMGQGGKHRVLSYNGPIISKTFDLMKIMIEAKEVDRWRKGLICPKVEEKEGVSQSDRVRHESAEMPVVGKAIVRPLKRSRESQTQITPSAPSAKRSRESKIQITPPAPSAKRSRKRTGNAADSEIVVPPLANFSFLISMGSNMSIDRLAVIALVEKLGGTVVETFAELVQSAKTKKPFLLSPCSTRTEKFFQCLAADVPCISQQWIFALNQTKGEVHFAKYRLPAGRSALGERNMVTWKERSNLLDDVKVGLVGSQNFVQTWSAALIAGRGLPVGINPDNINKDIIKALESFDCIMVDGVSVLPRELVDACRSRNVQMVTCEWLIQTLIHGRLMNYLHWPFQPKQTCDAHLAALPASF